MTLARGDRLGPYEISEAIGAGGMGEVFRARDTRLDRSVAIKVLPAHLAFSPELRERFDREARAISAVNHPNICTLYDVGRHDGTDYIVMELLDGETLAERIRKGPLPLEQVLRYGAQIAEGLDKAHRLGIVHRDLKPGNIMITRSGAKLLDFGLAKGVFRTISPDAPTEHQQRPLTAEGTIVGTFQYMAPEQLAGDDADTRTDIFALGTVLYEMATGRRAFEGKTKTSLIAAIVSADPPPLSQVQPLTPPALEHVIRRCLAKEPDERWQSAHDVAAELQWISTAPAAAAAAHTKRWTRRDLLLGAAAIVLLLAASIFAVLWSRERTLRPPRLVTSSLNAPAGWQYSIEAGLEISPDGTRLAFANGAAEEKARRLHIRDLATGQVTAIAGSEGVQSAFWSPDGRNVAFFAGGKLRRAAVSGGAAQTVCDAESPRGGTWSKDGTIVFTPVFRDGLFRVSSAGGEVTRVTRPDASRGETNHRWPHFLPDGKHVLFVAQRSEGGTKEDRSTIDVLSLESGARKEIVRANSSVFYSQGHILYWREGNLLAQRFDPGKLQTTGEPFVVAADATYNFSESLVASASEGGALVYVPESGSRSRALVWVDRTGRELSTVVDATPLFAPQLSTDGTRVAAGVADGGGDIWTFDVARGTRSRITTDAGQEYAPVWSPDDSKIAFASSEPPLNIWVIPSTGGRAEPVFAAENPIPRGWSRDGGILLEYLDSKLKWGIGIYWLKDRKFTPIIQTPDMDVVPVFSPDGQWIAFMSDQTGRFEVYVYSLATGQQWQISRGGGGFPRWSRDGTQIYFSTPNGSGLMAVPVTLQPKFAAEEPRLLFSMDLPIGDDTSFDVLNHDRFLLSKAPAESGRTAATFIQNWTLLKTERGSN